MDIKELKKLKRAAKMTNIEISDLSGIPVSTVNKIFSGATENPRYATLLAIEQVLRQKQKLPFRYDEYKEEPSLIQEQAAYYRYNSRKYSLEDIEKLDEVSGYELIDGMLYLKGAPTRMHEFLIMKISFAFQKHIYEKKGNCHVYVSKLGVSLFKDDKTWVAPDITVVCQRDKLTDEGSNYEKIAGQYLEKQGYQIIEYNFHSRYGEIDIIAKHQGYLVFVEVKYRENDKSGHPLEAVSASKQRTISKCAFYYLQKHQVQEEAVRFDVVGILGDKIQVIQNAFDFVM